MGYKHRVARVIIRDGVAGGGLSRTIDRLGQDIHHLHWSPY